MASPIPEAAPVTTATFPANRSCNAIICLVLAPVLRVWQLLQSGSVPAFNAEPCMEISAGIKVAGRAACSGR